MMAKIGQGGMGVFYKVFDHKQQRVVGLKALLQNANEEAILRFDNEIKIGSQLDHDHLVTVYETIEFVDGSRGMLMKFIDGDSLSKVIHKLTYRQAIDILLDVASGIAHMHAKGFVHRDLKPDNIIIRSNDARAFVTDFGIAKSMTDAPVTISLSSFPSVQSPDLTGGGLIGTVGFYDPSVTKNAPSRDLFALGAILYQLMADGQQAFRAYDKNGHSLREAPIDIARRILSWVDAVGKNQNPTWKIPPAQGLATRGTDYVAGEVVRIINKCFRRGNTQAFKMVSEFMADLLTIKVTKIKKEIRDIEKRLEQAMQIELTEFLKRTGVTIDPALNVDDMSEEELSDLLSSPVLKKDGKILVTAGVRDLLPPSERQALDDAHESLGKKLSLWKTEIGFLTNRIQAKHLPVTGLIADLYYELLEHEEFGLSREERDRFVDIITTYETPAKDGRHPMREALTQPLPVQIEDMKDYIDGNYVMTMTTPSVHIVEPILKDGEETGQYQLGQERDILGLSIGFGETLVLSLANEDYAPLSIPIQVPLKKRRELSDQRSPYVITPELIPKNLVPKGFTVIPGQQSVVGLPYGHGDIRYSIPQRSFRYEPFAAKVATLGDYYAFISRLVKEGRFDEAEKLAPRSELRDENGKRKLFLTIDRDRREVELHEKDPEDNWISLTQACRGISPDNAFNFAREEGFEAADMFRWEIAATGGIQGFSSGYGRSKPINLPSFNGLTNWGKSPDQIQIGEMDEIPAGVAFNENGSLINGMIGFFGSLFATSTPGTIGNIVTKGVALSATTDAVGYNARKQQIRFAKSLYNDVSSYTVLLIKKFSRKK